MDETEIALVRASFAKVAPIGEAAGAMFYDDLLRTAPELEPLFDQADMAEQGRKLMATLAVVVEGLDDLDRIVPIARDLAVRHVGYGVKPEDYDTAGDALIRTLRKGLGEDFTPEVEAAWTSAWGRLSAVMKAVG
jgi:nitric oxide dioxygenase